MPRPRNEHRYRFRGSIAPTKAVKRPVRAEVEETDDGPKVGKLHIDDVIDSWGGYWGTSAKEFNEALDELGDVDEIHVHINSPGGEVYEGISILNSLRRHPANVTAIVDGLAASAASFIAVGVDKTVMAPNTEMMIHDAWGIALGPAADMHAMGDRLDKLSNNIAGMYAEKAGGDADTWRGFMLDETWYSADEAVAAGLADEIEGAAAAETDDEDELIAASFDLSVFKHAGRASAPKPANARRKAPPAPVDELPPPEPVDDERTSRFADRRQARHNRRATARA
jgi:ATP-dependent Clp endopeptidase proteolytic subunit ClpP